MHSLSVVASPDAFLMTAILIKIIFDYFLIINQLKLQK